MRSSPEAEELAMLAERRGWGLSLALVGWLHLLAFSSCYAMTLGGYHDAPGYLAVWAGELLGAGLVFRLRRGPPPADEPPPLARFVVRVWASYFLLAFNLCTMNALRGNERFELFPAMASLASFGFLVMTFAVSRRFFPAVLVMFASGLLMAAFLLHAYLIFALAWWAVLNGIGLLTWLDRLGRQAGAIHSNSAISARWSDGWSGEGNATPSETGGGSIGRETSEAV